jgi:hypothetical protein
MAVMYGVVDGQAAMGEGRSRAQVRTTMSRTSVVLEVPRVYIQMEPNEAIALASYLLAAAIAANKQRGM